MPSKGRSRTEKCVVLIIGLIEEVMAVILKTSQHGMILHTQGKS